MSKKILRIHPADNVLVALTDLNAGEHVPFESTTITLVNNVPAKHKFVMHALNPDDEIRMYGITVGKALTPIPAGGAITTQNVKHQANSFTGKTKTESWT